MQENYLSVVLINFLSILGFMTFVWIISIILKNSSIVDFFWGLGFIMVSVVSIFLSQIVCLKNYLVLIMVSLWGSRLAIHILIRNWGKGEDYRYQNFRKKAGKNWWIISLFKVFMLQGAILFIISLGIQYINLSLNNLNISIINIIGIFIFLTGFLCESISDIQLYRFVNTKDNNGKVINKGLWKYSRHPNYFGESLIWWGIFFFAIISFESLILIISPLLITFLIYKVSGVKMLEKDLVKQIPGYKNYMDTTSAFIPWFKIKKK